MLQPSVQATEGPVNNHQTTEIAAQESRSAVVANRPKKINYEDYCVTKVGQQNMLINSFAIFNARVASKQLQIFLPSLMKELIPVMTFTSLHVEAL